MIIRLLFFFSMFFVQTRICGFNWLPSYFPVALSLSLFISLTIFTNYSSWMISSANDFDVRPSETFECISSVSSLRIQVVTSSELWDRRIHEIKWSTGCWERLSSFIVWGIQAFATSTMVKSGQSFDQWWTLEQDMYYGSRYQGESVLPCMETSSDTDLRHILLLMNIIEYWSYHDLCPFISDVSIWIWSMWSFFLYWIIIWFFGRISP